MYIPPFQLGIFVGAFVGTVGVIAFEIIAVLIDNRSKKRREARKK